MCKALQAYCLIVGGLGYKCRVLATAVRVVEVGRRGARAGI